MIVSTRSQTENVTPQKASDWLDRTYVNQRNVNKRKCEFYAGEMAKGRWQPTNTIAFAILGDDVHLVNGQHTLSAVLDSGTKLLQNPIVYYEVEKEEDIDNLYAHYDIGKPRSYSDSLRAFGVQEATGLPLHQINKLSSAIVYMESGFPHYGKKMDIAHIDLIALVYDWQEEWKQLLDIISPCDQAIRGKILMKAVASVALATLKYQETKAVSFWADVAQINKLGRNDPRLTLHKTLLLMAAKGSNNSFSYSPGHFSRASAYAWNKYYNDAISALIKVNTLKTFDPIKINGTPYA